MSPQLQVLFVGPAEMGGALDGAESESGRRLSVRTSVDVDLSGDPPDADCLLVDQRAMGETWQEGANLSVPVVSLHGPQNGAEPPADVTDALPRSLCQSHPSLVATRLATLAEADGKVLDPRAKELFENVSDGLVLHDPDSGTIVDVNERFCEIHGYGREELVGEHIDVVTAAEYGYEEATGRIQQAAEKGSQLFEWQNQRRGGETFPVEVHLSVVHIADGEYVLASVRDITEQKQREREFEEIFHGVHNPITVHDPGTAEVREVNDAFCELLGYSREEILEMGVAGYSHAEDGHTMKQGREFVREVVETGEPQRTEWQVETNDGERRWLDIEGTTVEIDGELQYVSMARDVTEQKRREREYEQIFNGVNDLVAVHDPETGELLAVNDTFVDVTGYDRETLFERGAEGMTVDTAEFSPGQIPRIIERVMRGEDVEPYEQAIETADGTRRWLEVNPTRAVIDGDQRFLAISRDVTARRERQQRLERERDRRAALFEDNPDPVLRIELADGEAVIREVNPAFERLFGYDESAVAGSSVEETLVPESEHETFEGLRGAVVRGETIEGQGPRLTADGIRQFAFKVIRFTVAERSSDAYVWYTDVTERRRRERAIRTLQETTARMQRAETSEDIAAIAVEAAREALDLPTTRCWLQDDSGRLDAVAATGDGTELLPATIETDTAEYDAFEHGTVTSYPPAATASIDSGLLLPLGGHGLLAAGQERDTAGDDLILDVARTLAEQTTTALDRIERAREVRESERRLQTIIDRIDEAIFLAPLSELSDGSPAPEFVSSGYEDIWGQPLEAVHEAYEDGFFGTLHPDHHDSYRAFIERIAEDIRSKTPDERYTREYRIQRPDGEVRWVQSDFYPTESEDSVTRLLIVSRDITDRKERTRTLESFHDATAELTTADAVSDASRIAVDAAADVFSLPATAVYHYDTDRATLNPTATGPGLPDAAELPSLTADDRAVWEAFVDEELHRVAVDDAPPLTVGPGEEALLFPLGGNGILVVWQSGESFDTDAASILAATLEAALNRVRGERRLESRRAELEAQTERAQRLDAITELTRRVEAAITGSSSRTGIQEAVCEELVDVEPFTGAWIAAAEVGTDRLTPRAVAGVDRDHVEQVLGQSDQTDPHPAPTAWQSGEMCVVNDLVGTGRRSDWRQLLLKRGAGAVCAVPLAYGGITYGVLTIVADDPGGFGERAQDILSQLSRSIGYAMTAIERQRALESDDTLELEFRATEIELPVAQLAERIECRAHYERTVRRPDGSVSVYYRLVGNLPGDVSGHANETLPGEVTVVSSQEEKAVVERQGSSWFGSIISEYGGVLRQCRATPESVTLVVELPRETETRTIVERLKEEFPSLELTAQRHHRETRQTSSEVQDRLQKRLSDRQYEAIETAYAIGYFDWPRESSGEEVADQLGITQPTVNKHIRLAEQKVFDLLFESP